MPAHCRWCQVVNVVAWIALAFWLAALVAWCVHAKQAERFCMHAGIALGFAVVLTRSSHPGHKL